MTTICAYVIPKALDEEKLLMTPARICKELADGFWEGTSYCVGHLELVALGKG